MFGIHVPKKLHIIKKLHLSEKAIAEIISYAIIVILTIALVGTAYTWGMPLIIKRQHTTKVERLYNSFNEENANSLVRKIEEVAKNGGRATFVVDTSGLWTLHEYNETSPDNNTLEFVTFSKVTNVGIGDWSSLTYGDVCPPQDGIVGIDAPLVVCAKSETFTNGFNIKYRAWSRTLFTPTGAKGYKINLERDPNGQLASNQRTVKITREEPYTCTPPDEDCPTETLIITKIKILLI